MVDGSSVRVSLRSSSAGLVFMVFIHSGMNMRGRLKRSARAVQLFGRLAITRDLYFEILGAPRGIMVTPSVDFDF